MTTPWLWTDSRSDFDIRITPWHKYGVKRLLLCSDRSPRCSESRLDGEIDLPNGFSINLKECWLRSLTLLAKG
ncbi:phosphoribosyl-dephospho-CoA transferase MdcG domain-containing protein [Klebsiella pneumoniae]